MPENKAEQQGSAAAPIAHAHSVDWPSWVAVVATFAFLSALLFLTFHPGLKSNDVKEAVGYVLATLFGLSVGAAELVSRYRDKPTSALNNYPAAIYLLVNAAASLVAYWLLLAKRLDVNVKVFGNHPVLNALVLGGFGAMALFRTSLFNVRIADTSVSVGPAAVLQIILRVTDREIDRLRAGPRAADVSEIMGRVVYQRARETLPLHCWALMQNVSAEEQNSVDQALSVLDRKTSMSDEAKAYSLGLILMNLVGEEVLRRAVSGLGDRIKGPPPDMPVVLGRVNELKEADLPPLLALCRALSGTETQDGAPGSEPSAASLKKLDAILDRPDGATEEADYILVVLARLRRTCGAETVDEALTNLLRTRVTAVGGKPKFSGENFAPPPPPAAAPAPGGDGGDGDGGDNSTSPEPPAPAPA